MVLYARFNSSKALLGKHWNFWCWYGSEESDGEEMMKRSCVFHLVFLSTFDSSGETELSSQEMLGS
jgi:hypothetical protein